jgi:hypothetical protein
MWPIRSAYDLLETHGLRAGSREIGKKLAMRIKEYNGRRSYCVIGKNLGAEDPVEGRSHSASVIHVREGEPAEILALRPDDQARMHSYLAKNYRCAVVVIDGEKAGWCWWIDSQVSKGRPSDHQLTFFNVRLGDRDVWCFDFFITPELRGEGRATNALAELERMLAFKGYKRMMGYVEPTNIAAAWMWKLRGFRTIRRVTATYLLSVVGISRGRLLVRVNEGRGRGRATFPFRLVRVSKS